MKPRVVHAVDQFLPRSETFVYTVVMAHRQFEASRVFARRPNAEYGAANYPVRLYEHSLACVGAIEDFVGAIRDRRAPSCSIDEAGRTVLACLAGVESYRTNRPVAVGTFES